MAVKNKKLTSKEKTLVQDAFIAGFMSAGDGWNGEYPFNDGHFEAASLKNRLSLKRNVTNYIKKCYGNQK